MPSISPIALQQLRQLYQKSGTIEAEEEEDERENKVENDSSNESGPIVKVLAITTPESFSHHLPSAALAILKGNNLKQQQQPYRSREKIDSITKDLSNVDLD